MTKQIDQQIVSNIAKHAANWIFEHRVDKEIARQVAANAGDDVASSVLRDLGNRGYTVGQS